MFNPQLLLVLTILMDLLQDIIHEKYDLLKLLPYVLIYFTSYHLCSINLFDLNYTHALLSSSLIF